MALNGCTARAYPQETAPKPFYMGVYLYEYRLDDLAKAEQKDYFTVLEEHLKILKAHGVNAVYLGGANRDRFGQEINLFKKYGISVVPQLDFAYYQPSWNDTQMLAYAKQAAAFINNYYDEPNILAFSVREEVPQSAANGLARYYAAILALAPKARFQLINNNLGAATDLPVPDPVIMGTDRYAFWWEFSGGGYLASPEFALNWTRDQARQYYTQAARRGADFSLVVTQGGLMLPASANKYAGEEPLTYPSTKDAQDKLRQRVRTFASEGTMGWGEFDSPKGKRFNVWKYYRLPQNCMRALAWTAVLEGAKSFYVWSYSPPDLAHKNSDFKSVALQENPPGEFAWITLAGLPGVPNPQLEEFFEAAEEIRPYENIVSQMWRTDETMIKTDQKQVFHNAFALPKMSGRVVVIQNSNVGTWPANSASFFKDSDDIRIDDHGNLVGYKPFDEPLVIHFNLAANDTSSDVYDLRSGKKLTPHNSQYTVDVAPGAGTLVFIGNAEEAQKLHGWMK